MKNKIAWHTDETGMVVGPRVHDGHLAELQLTDGNTLRFCVLRSAGGIVEFELLGMSFFGISNFTNGAILSEVFVWKLADAPKFRFDGTDNPWRVLFCDQLGAKEIEKATIDLSQTEPGALLLYVSCAYGGTISGIGKHLDVHEV